MSGWMNRWVLWDGSASLLLLTFAGMPWESIMYETKRWWCWRLRMKTYKTHFNKFWGEVFHEGSWWCPWQPRGNICCFIPSVSLRRSGPGSLRLIRHFIRSHHTLIIQNNAQSKKLQSFKVIYNEDQYNTMLKDNVHGQKVKSCTIEINTIQNAQRCPGARSKWSFSQRGSNVSASACFVCCV